MSSTFTFTVIPWASQLAVKNKRIISGEYKGKVGIITDTVRMGPVGTPNTPIICFVQFDDGTIEQFEPSELEVVPWE